VNVVGIAWVVLTPYLTGYLVGAAPRVNRVVARHIVFASALGWTAAGALVAGVFLLGGSIATVVTLAAAPVVGLAFWLPARGGGGGGDDAADEPDDEPSPGARIDWDEFERARRDWQRERQREPIAS
jgi:hypothetical protein